MPTIRQYLRRPELTARQALDAPISELVGISDEAAAVLSKALQVRTIHDLAESPYFDFAEEVTKSVAAPKHTYRRFGVPADRVVKDWEAKPVSEICEADLSALEGIGDKRKGEIESALGVKTVRELAAWPPFLQARELLAEAKRGGGVRSKVVVEGRVFTERGTPAAGTVVRLYHKAFGGERKRLAETKTNDRGFYSSQFKELETTNLEVWAVGPDGKEVPLSRTKFRIVDQQINRSMGSDSIETSSGSIGNEITRISLNWS